MSVTFTSQRTKRLSLKSGQAVVEYILMVGAVVGVIVATKQIIFEKMNSRLQTQKQEIIRQAETGGMGRLDPYYSNACARTLSECQ